MMQIVRTTLRRPGEVTVDERMGTDQGPELTILFNRG